VKNSEAQMAATGGRPFPLGQRGAGGEAQGMLRIAPSLDDVEVFRHDLRSQLLAADPDLLRLYPIADYLWRLHTRPRHVRVAGHN
jgi:hypothetical protein